MSNGLRFGGGKPSGRPNVSSDQFAEAIEKLPADWCITHQEIEDARAEASRLAAEIGPMQERLALLRRKIAAADYLIADRAKRAGPTG